jgi:hypothetical protein
MITNIITRIETNLHKRFQFIGYSRWEELTRRILMKGSRFQGKTD